SFKEETVIDLAKTYYTLLPQNVADNGVLKGCIFVRWKCLRQIDCNTGNKTINGSAVLRERCKLFTIFLSVF
ncbi:MAG: hypothetical protein PUI58_02680, partial [Solobacterium sp.]|nr:hypothetical protein [Solobacterium sp.]